MKKLSILMILIIAFSMLITACGSFVDAVEDSVDATADVREEELDDEFDAEEDALDATADAFDTKSDAPEAGEYASAEVCAAVEVLDASLDVLDNMDPPADTWEDYKAQFQVIQQDYEALQATDAETGGVYATELEAFANAMSTFEEKLLSLGGGGLLGLMSGVMELALAAGDLAIAGDILDDAIDCPGVKGAAPDSTEPAPAELCAAIEVLDASLEVLDNMDPPADSLADYQAQFDVIQQDWQAVREAGIDLYPNAIENFDKAMVKFESKLDSLGGGGLISGLLGLALAAGDLAIAGDALDDAIDCPEVKGAAPDSNEPAPAELCAAVDVLEASLEVLDRMDPPADTLEDYQAQFDVIQQDWQVVRDLGIDLYPNAIENFDRAITKFETKLDELGGGGLFSLMSELIGLALAAGDLAIAGDILDDAIDCPEVKGAVLDSSEAGSDELCVIVDELDEITTALDLMDPDQFEIEEYYAIKLVLAIELRQNYEALLDVGGEQYPEAFSNYEKAVVEYETALEALNEEWSASRLWDHLMASGQLVIAKETLGFVINCPGT